MREAGSVRLIDSTFVWDISDFTNKCKAVGEYIESPYFAAGDIPLNDIKWYLRLYPLGETTENENFVSVYLFADICTDVSELKIGYKLYLWNNNEVNLDVCKKSIFSKATNCGWGYDKFLEINGDKLKNHISMSIDSTLSIACYISSSTFFDNTHPYTELSKDFSTVHLSENLSDVTIEIDDQKLKAHKIILSARSEVFSAMFKHNMKESNESIIKVTDISYDTMKEMLRFIYSGVVKNLDSLSKDLLIAAEKYSILTLKKMCEESLKKNLNVSNVCETINDSNLFQSENVKEVAIEFIIKHLKEVIDTEGFDLISKDSKLCTDIFRKISLKKIS